MADFMSHEMEKAIVNFAMDFPTTQVCLEEGDYKRIELRIWDDEALADIQKTFKLQDIGSVLDYPELPQPDSIMGYDIIGNYDNYQRIMLSKKYDLILFTTGTSYSTTCTFLVDNDFLEKFSKKMKPILDNEEEYDIFKGIDFKCKKNEYIEVNTQQRRNNSDDGENKIAIKRKVKENENLVFDPDSEIYTVMNDIMSFFTDETKNLYKKMDIEYKRGIIIYGNPGNGKSAMIREIIRRMSKINKILINPGVMDVTRILSAIINKLDKQKTIIIIEDIDSLITPENRSAFLNILDGVGVKSGIYFIGTTNYPERIDPAFMNRSGRFDRSYNIGNPDANVRQEYFKSKNIDKLLSEFTVHQVKSKDKKLSIIELFTKHSDDLSMANLKEFMIMTQYMLATKKFNDIESALIESRRLLDEAKKAIVYEGPRPRMMKFPPMKNRAVGMDYTSDDED